MARARVSYSAARRLIDSGQASAEDIAANFDLVMDESSGPSVADQARASMERRKAGGDLPPGYAPDSLDKTFMGGVKDQLIPSGGQLRQIARAGYEMNPLTAPAAAVYDYATGQTPAAWQIAKGVGGAMVNEARKAVAPHYMPGGDAGFVERVGHGAAAVLPVVGPAAAEAGEDIKRGDIAYGLGKGTALVGSMLAPEAAVKGVQRIRPPMAAVPVANGLADVQAIVDNSGFKHVGVRTLHRMSNEDVVPNLKVGDIAPPSRTWRDDVLTGKMEKGASAVNARDPNLAKLVGGYGMEDDTVVLLGSNRASRGVDPSELVMREPRVLWVGKRADITGERLTASASFADNLKRIAAASPDAPTLTGILKGAGPKVVKGSIVAAIGHAVPIPGFKYLIEFLGGERAAMAGWKALRDVPKTAAFKAADVTLKTQFAKALTTGQIADAITIGGRIVAGETAANTGMGDEQPKIAPPRGSARERPASGIVGTNPDDWRPAETSETTALSPEQERMFGAWAKASGINDVDHPDSHYDYRGYFLDTKGKPVPQSEGRHFPDTYKQHGHPTFSVESKYSKGANDGGRWDGDTFVAPASGENWKRRISRFQEWPLDPNARDENHDLLTNTNPKTLLPERFKHARAAVIATPIKPGILEEGTLAEAGLPPPQANVDTPQYKSGFVDGKWHQNFLSNDYDPSPSGPVPHHFDTVYVGREAGEADNSAVTLHELNHLVMKDLTKDEQRSFMQMYLGSVQGLRDGVAQIGIRSAADLQDPAKHAAYQSLLAKYPRTIIEYLNEPAAGEAAPVEVFAELGGQYMANPSAFKRSYPQWYGWFRQLYGREYIQQNKR